MVLYGLKFEAQLENVKEIIFPEEYVWQFDVKHPTAEEFREGVTMTSVNLLEVNGRHSAHYVMKWKGSKHVATMEIKNKYRPYKDVNSETSVLVAEFECRGLVPVKCHPGDGVTVVSRKGKVFEDVDFTDKEWVEYDEDSNESVEIMNVKFEFTS